MNKELEKQYEKTCELIDMVNYGLELKDYLDELREYMKKFEEEKK